MPRNENAPSARPVAITKSDATVYNPPLRSIRCGGAGTLVVTLTDDSDLTIESVLAGETIPVYAKKVKAATTATLMTGYR